MVQYMNYLEREAVNYIQPYSKRSFGDLGDWLAIQYTNSLLTNTAYFAYDAQLMSKIAETLGKKKDAAYYQQLYENIKQSFNHYAYGAIQEWMFAYSAGNSSVSKTAKPPTN